MVASIRWPMALLKKEQVVHQDSINGSYSGELQKAVDIHRDGF